MSVSVSVSMSVFAFAFVRGGMGAGIRVRTPDVCVWRAGIGERVRVGERVPELNLLPMLRSRVDVVYDAARRADEGGRRGCWTRRYENVRV